MSDHSFSKEKIAAVLSELGVNPDEIEQRKAYLDLTAADAGVLRELQHDLQAWHPHLLEQFYQHLFKFDSTSRLLTNPNIVSRLKQSQHQYFKEITNGQYDWEYVIDRLQVGLVHEKVGLAPRWYIGSYCKYLIELVPAIFATCQGDEEKAQRALQAILKVAFFDIELGLDAYHYADKHSILQLQELTDNIVCSVPAGLLVLDQHCCVIRANSFFDIFVQAGHACLPGKTIDELFPDIGLAGRMVEVMRHGGTQSGIQYQWQDKKAVTHQINITIVGMRHDFNELSNASAARILLIVEDLTESERLRTTTRQADHRVRVIMENASEGIITIDDHGMIESFNKAAERLFGYTAGELVGKNIKVLMPDPYQENHDGYLERFRNTGERRCVNRGFREVQGLAKDGRMFDMELSISEIPNISGRLFIGIVRDISVRKQVENEMAKLSQALEQSADSVMITDRHGIVEYVNHGFLHTTGYRAEEILGKTPGVIKSGMQDQEFYQNLWRTILEGKVFRDILVNRRKSGDLYYEEKTITPLKNAKGEVTHFVSTGRDITERMRTQERLQFLAQHDILTSLPNRLLFLDRISQAIKMATRQERLVAVMFLDLDRFKKINDSLGHHIGDALLVTLAQRLKSVLRQGDTVARLSGDEFGILLPDLPSIDGVFPAINHIIDQFKNPFNIENNELFMTSSIGVTIFPTDSRDPQTLVKYADTAMYDAKKKGRGTYSFYTHDMNVLAQENLFLENELSQALFRKQFHLVYQPQISLHDNTLLGVEVLLRWRHPDRGLIPPDDFISLLEDTNLIVPVGDWILLSACRQMSDWFRRGIEIPRIAVNISPRQLVAKHFLQRILNDLTECHLQPQQLELEITENALIEDDSGATQVLQQLRHTGVHIAMDDFGTGYSSLSYLKQLPVTSLKIDGSFIQQLPQNHENDKLTNAIISMGRSLNLNVVAEGVETLEQYDFLQKHGCDAVQGFYLSPPLDVMQLEQFIHSARVLRH